MNIYTPIENQFSFFFFIRKVGNCHSKINVNSRSKIKCTSASAFQKPILSDIDVLWIIKETGKNRRGDRKKLAGKYSRAMISIRETICNISREIFADFVEIQRLYKGYWRITENHWKKRAVRGRNCRRQR